MKGGKKRRKESRQEEREKVGENDRHGRVKEK